MSEAKKEESVAAAAPAAPSAPKGPMLLALVGTLGSIALLGVVVFTKVLYQRPKITETGQREKLEAEAKVLRPEESTSQIEFKPFHLNIKVEPLPNGQTNDFGGVLHYATIGFYLKTRDPQSDSKFEEYKTRFLDQFINLMSTKTFDEINTVQGKYLLKAEMIEMINKLAKDGIVQNIHFTHFTVQ